VIAISAGDLTNLGAIAVLIGALGTALNSIGVIGPNRRKVIEDTNSTATTRATVALETALTRVESDNTRLRKDVDELEGRFEACMTRLRAAEADRDQLAARIERMLVRFAEADIAPPD
jgi:hypothetical protein